MLHKVIMSFLFVAVSAVFAVDRVAFITGGASGIGAATVRKFVQEKIKVGFLDVDRALGEALAAEFTPEEVLFIQGDVSQVADIRRAIGLTVDSFGYLDIIFANAGIYLAKNILQTSEEDWHRLIDINLKGVVFTVKEGLPYLIKNGKGSVVLMGSDQCFIGKRSSCAYGASKGAIGQLTKSLALDFGDQNIRVNTVCPATIRTPLAETALARWAEDLGGSLDVEDLWRAEAEKYPLKKYGSAAEVANLVYFLASDEASFITGSLYLIDGGLTAY